MKQEALGFFTDTHLTIIGFFIFFLFFIGVTLWTYRKNAKETYDQIAKLPLDNGGQCEQ